MSLRAKLVASFTLLLLVVIAAVGLVASGSIRTILTAQVDDDLRRFVERGPAPEPFEGPRPEPSGEPFLRPFAEVILDGSGEVLLSEPSGFADNPDPLPDVTALSERTGSGLTYLDAVDDSLEYRVAVRELSNGAVLVLAAPLRNVATATASLVRTLLLAGGGVLLIGATATWWTVRRGMAPVDEMVQTAEAIADGDLTSRVVPGHPRTELGRLGASLNEMLSTIEHAVATEREGKDRLRRFAADASHELRTPLATISGYAELHRRGGLADPGDAERAWERIESESARMRRLVEDLLMLARLDQTQPVDRTPFDLAGVVRDVVADQAAMDPTRTYSVEAPRAAELLGDEQRITQVVTNLVTNARFHTPEGANVAVHLSADRSSVRLVVADDGPGFPDGALDRVFERFYRADPSRSRRSGGSGLGLAIVEAIVRAHGGTVTAANAEEGGARVAIVLPRAGRSTVDPAVRAGGRAGSTAG
jgi:two-component system OmpR family sensor kinase